jgi:hypothetical protein
MKCILKGKPHITRGAGHYVVCEGRSATTWYAMGATVEQAWESFRRWAWTQRMDFL